MWKHANKVFEAKTRLSQSRSHLIQHRSLETLFSIPYFPSLDSPTRNQESPASFNPRSSCSKEMRKEDQSPFEKELHSPSATTSSKGESFVQLPPLSPLPAEETKEKGRRRSKNHNSKKREKKRHNHSRHRHDKYKDPKDMQGLLKKTDTSSPQKYSYYYSDRSPIKSVFEQNNYKLYPVMQKEFSDTGNITLPKTNKKRKHYEIENEDYSFTQMDTFSQKHEQNDKNKENTTENELTLPSNKKNDTNKKNNARKRKKKGTIHNIQKNKEGKINDKPPKSSVTIGNKKKQKQAVTSASNVKQDQTENSKKKLKIPSKLMESIPVVVAGEFVPEQQAGKQITKEVDYHVANIMIRNDTNVTVIVQILSAKPIKNKAPSKRYIFPGKEQYVKVKQKVPSSNFLISVKTKSKRKIYREISNQAFKFEKEPFQLLIKLGKDIKPFEDEDILAIPFEIIESPVPLRSVDDRNSTLESLEN
jgi:hypothetical protein